MQPARLPGAYPDALNGDDAIRSLGNNAGPIAARNGLTPGELVLLLQRDRSAWLANGRVMYIDTAVPTQAEPPALARAGVQQVLTQEEVFKLHSRPGALRVIHLDFDGHHSVDNSWNHDIQFPPYDTEGDPTTFSSVELLTIEAQFQRVAEDFAPFDVDVTTEEPPPGGLIKSGAGDTTWGGRCVLTQPTSGFGNGIGGVALLHSFAFYSDGSPCFAFNKGTNNGSMTASHEVGHMLGLAHDGLLASEYHPGVGGSGTTSWGPIMGAPFGKNLVQWSNGTYAGATNDEDDFLNITKAANGTPFRIDDLSGLIPGENGLTFPCPERATASVPGLIETPADADTFTFETEGGLVTIEADPLAAGPNLDILLELYDARGALLASANELDLVDATLEATLPAGTYTVRIDGGERIGRYSDYGSLGEYTLQVTVPLWQSTGSGASGSPLVLTGLGTACELEPTELAIRGAAVDSFAFLVFGSGEFRQPFLGGVLVPDVSRAGDVWMLPTDGAGNAVVLHPWPAGMPSGTRMVFQAWAVDPTRHAGFASSNAIAITTP